LIHFIKREYASEMLCAAVQNVQLNCEAQQSTVINKGNKNTNSARLAITKPITTQKSLQ